MGQESLTIFRNTWSHSLHKGSTQPKIYSIHLILEYAIPGLWHRTPNFLRCSSASAFAADAVKATIVSFLSCPCLSMFVLVFSVVLVSSYRLCCLPFPSCSMFFYGWLMFFVVDGWLCLCLCSIVHFSVLPSVRLSVVCASFVPVFVWFLIPFGVRCLMPVVFDCVCGFCCGACCLCFLPLLLFVASFVLVSVILCVCVWWSFLMGDRF